jgi:hypothetical protein
VSRELAARVSDGVIIGINGQSESPFLVPNCPILYAQPVPEVIGSALYFGGKARKTKATRSLSGHCSGHQNDTPNLRMPEDFLAIMVAKHMIGASPTL